MLRDGTPTPTSNNWAKPGVWLALLVVAGVFAIEQIRSNFTASGIYEKAVDLQKAGRCREALVKLQEVVRRDETKIDARFLRGVCSYQTGNYDLALAEFSEAIRLRPAFPQARHYRALTHRVQGRDEEAMTDLDASIRLDPANPDAHGLRGNILRERGLFDDAVSAYATASHLRWDGGRFNFLRIDTLRDKGDIGADAAIAVYDEMISKDPENQLAHIRRAVAKREKGDIDAAVVALTSILERWPEFALGHLERGTTVLFHTDDPAKAAEDLAKAVSEGFRYQSLMTILDAAEDHLGLPHSDVRNRIVPQTPFVPEIFYWIIRLHVARLHAGQKDTSELTENLKQVAIALNPGLFIDRTLPYWPSTIVQLFLGRVTAEAVRAESNVASAAGPRRRRHCDADFYLAEYELQKGDRDAARKLFEAAADNCPPSAPERSFARAEIKRLFGN